MPTPPTSLTSPDTADEPLLSAEPGARSDAALHWRQWIGLGIVLLGVVAAFAQVWAWIANQPVVLGALWAGWPRRWPRRWAPCR